MVSKENVGAKISVLGFTSQIIATIFHFLSLSLGKCSSPLYVQEEADAIVNAACRPSRTAETAPPGRNGFLRKSVPAHGDCAGVPGLPVSLVVGHHCGFGPLFVHLLPVFLEVECQFPFLHRVDDVGFVGLDGFTPFVGDGLDVVVLFLKFVRALTRNVEDARLGVGGKVDEAPVFRNLLVVRVALVDEHPYAYEFIARSFGSVHKCRGCEEQQAGKDGQQAFPHLFHSLRY